MKKGKVGAVILAGGRGSRMQSQIQKQYMSLGGRPLICHALEAFENSSWEDIADAQFATRAPGVALVKHTESVTANALMIARNTVEKYGYEIDTDILILAAVLHDVCKLEEMEMSDQGSKTSRKSSLGKIPAWIFERLLYTKIRAY